MRWPSSVWLLSLIGSLGCGPGSVSAGATSVGTDTSGSTTGTESGSEETETGSEETETGSEETETGSEETGNEEEVCEFGCEGARVVAEGIVRCPDGRKNRIGGGTFDPTITAPACVGDEDILDCTSDAQCTSGMNGRCIQEMTYVEGDSGDGDGDPGTICQCAYSCSSDSDCEADSVCVPPELHPNKPDWPVCRQALCETGSDCGECGQCGMGWVSDSCGSTGGYVAVCRAADDPCSVTCDLGICVPQPWGWQCDYQRMCG